MKRYHFVARARDPLLRQGLAIGLLLLVGCQTTGGEQADAQPETVDVTEAAPAAEPASSDKPAPPLIVEGVPPVSGDGVQAYQIGIHDLLKITVFQVPDLSGQVRVNSRGEISLALIGLVQAGGLTIDQLERELTRRYSADYLQDPQINVFVEEYTSQRVTLEGWIKKPGVYPLEGRMTLMQAIALGEGVDELAKPEDILLFRDREDGRAVAYRIDLESVRRGDIGDPVVVGDDRIFIPKSNSRAFLKGFTDTLRGFVRPLGF